MSWELASFLVLGAVLLAGFAWYERSRPTSQVVALVAALAALAIAGRIAFAAFPNVKPTTDIVIFAGYALGPAPGFVVGALTALVSNFWFGQGPWTPWQMVGWGLCGILGRRLGAWSDPAPAASPWPRSAPWPGIAYGALLNFSLMATYGGDLSLQRFLALESRAVPFDAAHAISNATLALIAGPAMVRMLVRFRERFEWRAPAVVAVLLLALALVSVLPARAQASDTGRAAAWLVSAQNGDGGWGASPESASSAATTAWAMLGLEAAGRNPLDVSRGGHSPVDYLRARVDELGSPGDFARTILALEGAGVDPRSFGGHDLVSALAKRRRGNGSYEGWPGSTAFAVIALRAAGARRPRSVDLLAGQGPERRRRLGRRARLAEHGRRDRARRCRRFPTPRPPATAWATCARRSGQAAASRSAAPAASTRSRPPGRCRGCSPSAPTPARSRRAARAPSTTSPPARTADGHYRYSDSSDQTPVWVTGQVLAAAAGDSYPVPTVAREANPAPPSNADSGAATTVPPPPAAGTGSAQELLETLDQGSPGSAPPSTGGVGPSTQPPATGDGAVPVAPPGASPEGDEAEPAPAQSSVPTFEAGDNPGPEPWAPIGIGLATAGLALGSVLLLGRRFSW